MWGWGASSQESKAMEFCDLMMTAGKQWSEIKDFCVQSCSAHSDFVPVRTVKELASFLNRKVVGEMPDCRLKVKRAGYDKHDNTACVFCNFTGNRTETHWVIVFRFDRKTETIDGVSLHCTSCEREKREKMFDSAYETLLSSTSIVSHTSMAKLDGSRVMSRRISQIQDCPQMSPSFYKNLKGYKEYEKGCKSGQPCLCKLWHKSDESYGDDDDDEENEKSPPPAPARRGNSSNRKKFSSKERKRLSNEGMKLLRRVSRTMDEPPSSFSSYSETPPSFSEDPPSFSDSNVSLGEAFRRGSKSAPPSAPRRKNRKKSAPPPPRRKPSHTPPPRRKTPSQSSADTPPSFFDEPRRSSGSTTKKKTIPQRRKPSHTPPPRRRSVDTPPSFSNNNDSDDEPPSFTSNSSPSKKGSTTRNAPPPRRKKSNAPPPPRRKKSNAPPPPRRKKSNAPPPPGRRKKSDAPPPRTRRDAPPPRRKKSNAPPPPRRKKSDAPAPRRRQNNNRRLNDTPPSFSSRRSNDTPPSFSDGAPPSFGGTDSPSPPRFSRNNQVAPSSYNDYEEEENDSSSDGDVGSPIPLAPPRRVFTNY